MKPNSETPETEFTFIIKHWYWCDACGWKKMPRVKPLPCPFCGKIPNVYPTDPSREGNAFGGGLDEAYNLMSADRAPISDWQSRDGIVAKT